MRVPFLKNLSIYPNPCKGNFHIILNHEDSDTPYNYTITSNQQELIDEGIIIPSKEINLDHNQGLYFIKIYNDQDLIIKKLFVY